MILKIFLFWRLGLFLTTYLGSLALPKIANSGLGAFGPNKNFDFWASWAQWDGGHYLKLAKAWYIQSSDFAFFPLFPAVVRILSGLLGENYLLSGLIISNLSFLAFLLVFYRFVQEKFSSKVAYSTVISLIVFPTTFFAVALYSESLFLLFCALTFWFLLRKKFLHASIAASLASLTRGVGVFLILPIFYSYLSSIRFDLRKINVRVLHVSVAFFGFSLYALYLFANFNDPFNFLTAQGFWQRSIIDPASTIFGYAWAMLFRGPRPLNDYFDLALTLLFLSSLILGTKRLPSSLWIFSILTVLLPASTGTLTSMPRYLIASLGVFIILGQLLETNPKLKPVLWSISLVLQVILTSLFINGFWVA